MLNDENFDIDNEEAIKYLRGMMVQLLTRVRECEIESERKNTSRLTRLKEDWKKTQTPEERAKSHTIFNNIVFFLGSLIAPSITPSELFGKEKVDPKIAETYEQVSKMQSSLVSLTRASLESIQETIMAVNKAIDSISSSDEKLVELVTELNNQFENTAERIPPFANAMYKCGYYNPETYKRVYPTISIPNMDIRVEFTRLINSYMNTYGNNSIQKGR